MSAPSQKIRPTSAARWISRFSAAGSRSMRARDQRLQRVRHAVGDRERSVGLGEHADRLLDEERVALRDVEDLCTALPVERRPRDQRVDQLLRLVVGERLELDGGGA